MTRNFWRLDYDDWVWVPEYRGTAYTVSQGPPPPEEPKAIGFKTKPVQQERRIGFRPPR